MNIIYDTQSTINENINLRLNGLRLRSETGEGLKNLNGKWIQICMRGFRPFSGSPGLRAGSGAADFLHARHPIPQSRSAPAGGWNPRPRSWPWSWRGAGKSGRHGSMFALSGPEGVRPRPGRVVGKQGWPGASRSGATRARVCRIKRVSVCPAAGEGSRMPIRVSAGPKAEVRTNAGSAFGRMPGLPGYAWVSQPNRAVGLPERGACCGYGRSAVLAARKNEGSPERLPSPSKINP